MGQCGQLNSVSDVIAAFGGVTAMAQVFGGVPSRFGNYQTKGEFPRSMHMSIYVECLKRGLKIAPELVGMTSDVMAIARGERQRVFPLQAAE